MYFEHVEYSDDKKVRFDTKCWLFDSIIKANSESSVWFIRVTDTLTVDQNNRREAGSPLDRFSFRPDLEMEIIYIEVPKSRTVTWGFPRPNYRKIIIFTSLLLAWTGTLFWQIHCLICRFLEEELPLKTVCIVCLKL